MRPSEEVRQQSLVRDDFPGQEALEAEGYDGVGT